jgi:putative ATP-dependent endonuclease of OLD family
MSAEFQDSGIKITEVRIRNFRSLKEVNVSLDWLTVLIGANNSGKTSFLDALFAAIGAGKREISKEDIFLAPSENTVSRDRKVTIDLLIRPSDDNGSIIDSFPKGSYWVELWGEGVSQDDRDNEYVGIRTQMKWDSTQGEYKTERKFLKDWQNDPNDAETKGSISTSQIEPLALYLLDAKRDISDELRSRSSFWYRLVSNPGIDDEKIKKLEYALTRLNADIISGSVVLGHVQDHLDDLYKTIGGDRGSVSITPIPRHVRDLSKGMDVNFATKGAQTFPLARHGMGTRSLAAVLMFRAYSTWRQKNANDDKVHPMLALEEPEAHLHPQAHRALFNQIEEMPGQRIISTHSPYIAGQAKIAQFRHFRKDGANTAVTQMDIALLTGEDIRKIDRMVMNTRGELLYARALVLFEGETEEQALPTFAGQYWKQHPHALGITMIGVGGYGNYLPFMRLASSFKIPWYIFSDGESDAVKAVHNTLETVGEPIDSPRVFIIPGGKNFEKYITTDEYKDILINMIIAERSKNDHHKKALNKEWANGNNPLEDVYEELSEYKTKYGKPLAEAITGMAQENLRFPALIRVLFEKMSDDLGLEKRMGAVS